MPSQTLEHAKMYARAEGRAREERGTGQTHETLSHLCWPAAPASDRVASLPMYGLNAWVEQRGGLKPPDRLTPCQNKSAQHTHAVQGRRFCV